MPTYEYQCAKGHAFEAFQKISARPKSRCPECGARATRIISGGSGLIFKGAGFYITDYGKDGKGPRKDAAEGAPVEKAAVPAPSDGAASKPEASKPEASKAEASKTEPSKKSSKKVGKDAE